MAFKSLESSYRGPFSTVSEFYHASCLLGKAHARTDPKEESPEQAIEDFETLNKMIPKLRIDEYENGPFVLFHNDLTVQNILVSISSKNLSFCQITVLSSILTPA